MSSYRREESSVQGKIRTVRYKMDKERELEHFILKPIKTRSSFKVI